MFNTEPWIDKGLVYTLPRYAFLPEVFDEFGQTMFREEWTGEEPTNFGPGPKIPSASDVFIGESDSPQNFELLKTHQKSVFELIGARPVGTPTFEQWCDARTIWYEKEREWPKAAKRLNEVVEVLHDLAAEGEIIFSCALESGEMVDVSPALWNCQRSRVWDRFRMCRIAKADLSAPRLSIEQRPPSDDDILHLLATDEQSQSERDEYWNTFTEYLFVRRDRLGSAIDIVKGAAGNQTTNITSDAPEVRSEQADIESLPQLPPGAAPNDHKHAPFAHAAAAWLRENGGGFLEAALRHALEDQPEHAYKTMAAATRIAFNKLYDKGGNPHA